MGSITIQNSMTLPIQNYGASSSALYEFFALTPSDGGEVVFLNEDNERVYIKEIVVNYTTTRNFKETSDG